MGRFEIRNSLSKIAEDVNGIQVCYGEIVCITRGFVVRGKTAGRLHTRVGKTRLGYRLKNINENLQKRPRVSCSHECHFCYRKHQGMSNTVRNLYKADLQFEDDCVVNVGSDGGRAESDLLHDGINSN